MTVDNRQDDEFERIGVKLNERRGEIFTALFTIFVVIVTATKIFFSFVGSESMSTAEIRDLNNFYWFSAVNFGTCFCFVGFYFIFHCLGLLDERKNLSAEDKSIKETKKVNRMIFTLDWFLFIDLISAIFLLFFIVLYAVALQEYYSDIKMFTMLFEMLPPLSTHLLLIKLILTILMLLNFGMSSFFGLASLGFCINFIYFYVHKPLKNAMSSFFNALLWIYR
jgi:hypothetical protein